MGSNPSKSQQLSERFPDYKILPELSLHPSNSYELIYVVKLAINQIFIIKETTRDNLIAKEISECENILRCLDTRKIDNMYYSLYEWMPTSLERFISSHPSIFNLPFFVYLIQTLVQAYALLWKFTNGLGLDIVGDNIRAVRDPFGKLKIKVIPPSVTYCSFPKKTKIYRNQVKNLGEVLRKLCLNREKQIGQNLFNFVTYRMSQNLPNTYESWESLERDSKKLSQLLRIVPIENNRFRSVSPIIYEKVGPPPGRTSSPLYLPNAVQNADHSPQISRVVVRDKTPIIFSNIPVNDINQTRYRASTTPVKDQRRPINQNYNSVVPQRNEVRPISPMNIHQKPQLFTHQNIAQNYTTSPCKIKIDYKNPAQIDQKSQVTPSPMRYYNTNKTQSSGTTNKTDQNFTEDYQSTDIPKQRNFNLERKNQDSFKYKTLNQKRNEVPQNGTRKISQTKQKIQTEEAPKAKRIYKTIKFPLFEPLARDLLEINPRLGVPSNKYVPKTREDNQSNIEDGAQQSSKSSLNLQTSGQNFINKQLGVRDVRSLLGSSIPVIEVDKSSSFGLSEDSYQEQSPEGFYDGVYEGAFHPKFKNIRHGSGRLVFPSGGSYQGGFAWNKMEGWGKLFYASGRLAYEGYWKNSKFEGYGKLFNENPIHIDTFDCTNFNLVQVNADEGYWKYYEGNMKNDLKQGHGVLVLQNGQKYDGEFHEDRVEGLGIFLGKKQCIEGKWQNNLLVNIIKRV